jgi:hypothetical protein
MDAYTQSVLAVVRAQMSVIGPMALDQARQVKGLKIIDDSHIQIEGDFKTVMTHLVQKYSYFFGQASIEVCKDAIREINPPINPKLLPDNLL